MTTKPPDYLYVVLTIDESEHLVCIVHDHSPDWYRRVATFRNKDRALDYATMENDFRPGMGILDKKETPLPGREDDDEPAPEALRHVVEPPSALKPQEFVRRSTIVEHTRIAQVEERSGHAPELVQVESAAVPALPPASNEEAKSDIPPEAVPQLPTDNSDNSRQIPAEPSHSVETTTQLPPVGNSRQIAADTDNAPQTPPMDLTDAATLDHVTEKQAKVFKVIVAITARGDRAGFRNAAIEAGYASVQDSIEALTKRGYLVRAGEMGGVYWVPLAQGEPRVSTETKNWTDTQRKALREVCAAGGDMAVFAASIGRSEGACLARAREYGVFEQWRAARWPAHVAQPDEVTSIDLSPRQQVLLHVIITEGGNAIHASKHNVEPDRVPDILKRLEAHGCIVIGEGGWQATPLGKKVHGQIKAAGVPELPKLTKGNEVKISMPVVRRINGDGKEVKPAEAARTYTLFDMETYLRHKRHAVTKLTSGEFIIDGVRKTKAQALVIVNTHRAAADPDLAPKTIDQVK